MRTLAMLACLAVGTATAQEPTTPLPDAAPQSTEAAPAPRGPRGGGDGFLSAVLDPRIGILAPIASYGARWAPNADVAQRPGTTFGIWTQDLMLLAPVFQDDQRELGATFQARGLHSRFSGGRVDLRDGTEPFPGDLWNLRLGLVYRQRLGEEATLGAVASFGSASDRPFNSLDETVAAVQAFVRLPVRDRDAWVFSLVYNTASELVFPIPGVAYHYQPSDRFEALLGLPFFLRIEPIDNWTVTAFYVPVRNVNVRSSYRLFGPVSIYAGYEWANDSYFRVEREDERSRLFLYEMRLSAGIAFPLSRNAFVDLFGGYAFDRFWFEGRRFDDRDHNRVDLADAPFVGGRITVRW